MLDKKSHNAGLWLCIFLIMLAVLSRIVPHPANFTPIAALGLFSGACLRTQKFWLIPITALLLSDMIIGFYNPVVMVYVYTAFVLCAYLGRAFLSERRNVLTLGVTTLSGALVFFILSNLGDWLSGLDYPLTLKGLLECYVMAIPFFQNTLLGDMFYVICLFGTYELCCQWLRLPRAMRHA